MRILLADDHSVVRRGLRTLLETQAGWEICGEAASGREAIEQARELKPDVIVMDISMPDLNGLEATRQITRKDPNTEVLILTLYDSDQMIREARDAGAHGYILKSGLDSDLLAAVGSLAEHKPYFRNSAEYAV